MPAIFLSLSMVGYFVGGDILTDSTSNDTLMSFSLSTVVMPSLPGPAAVGTRPPAAGGRTGVAAAAAFVIPGLGRGGLGAGATAEGTPPAGGIVGICSESIMTALTSRPYFDLLNASRINANSVVNDLKSI